MKIRDLVGLLGAAAAMSAAAMPLRAQADGAGRSSNAATPPADGLQDIIVTANKIQGSAQSTPIAIAVVSGLRLSEAGVTNVADLVKVAPAIQFTPIRQKAITFIRGVGQGISAGNADPAVAINLNDAYLPTEISNLAFFDVDRVEVVYGPQGTLYGRNAVGGAINVITRRPGKRLEADLTAEFGNYKSIMLTGGIDLPVSPDLGVRIAGLRNQHDGYFSNGMSDADLWALRLSALYEPDAATSFYLVGGYSRQRGFGEGNQNIPALTGDPWYLGYNPRDVPLFTHANGGTASFQIAHDFGSGVKLTSISGFAKMKQDTNFTAYLNVPGNLEYVSYGLHTRNYTQEFRLNGTSGNLSWILGIYGYDTRNGEFSYVRAQVLPSLTFETGPWDQHASGAAAFGQLTYSLTPALRLTGGARYSHDRKRLSGVNNTYLKTAAPAPAPTVIYSGTRSDKRPDFKVGLEYDAAARSLIYATFQTGYNNGGFSTAQAALGALPAAPFAPMTVKSWTLGAKNRFFRGRLQVNVELFYNRYKDYQVSARSLQTGQATVYNADKAETYGAQVDARLQITSQDEIGTTLALLHAKFETLLIPSAPFDLSGYDMPLAPRATVNVDYTHHFPLANGATIDLAGNYRHVSSQWGIYTHAAGTFIGAYDMADASLTYHAEGRGWSIGAFVRNLTDKFTTAFTLAGAIPGPGSGFPLPPRTYGVRLSAKL